LPNTGHNFFAESTSVGLPNLVKIS